MTEKLKAPQGEAQNALSKSEAILYQRIQRTLGTQFQQASENLDWLYANMHPYFFITMKEEIEAIVNLAVSLHDVSKQRKINLIDQEKKLIVARSSRPSRISLRYAKKSYGDGYFLCGNHSFLRANYES